MSTGRRRRSDAHDARTGRSVAVGRHHRPAPQREGEGGGKARIDPGIRHAGRARPGHFVRAPLAKPRLLAQHGARSRRAVGQRLRPNRGRRGLVVQRPGLVRPPARDCHRRSLREGERWSALPYAFGLVPHGAPHPARMPVRLLAAAGRRQRPRPALRGTREMAVSPRRASAVIATATMPELLTSSLDCSRVRGRRCAGETRPTGCAAARAPRRSTKRATRLSGPRSSA